MVRSVLGLVVAAVLALAGRAASLQPAPPPVEDYGRLPAIEFVTLSPSGDRYAFISTEHGRRRLVVATPAGQVLQANSLDELKVRGLAWAGENHLLLQASATADLGGLRRSAKRELGAVIVLDLPRRHSFTVFSAGRGRRVTRAVDHDYGAAEVGGHWYGFFGGYPLDQAGEPGRRPISDLYRVDLDSGETLRVAEGGPDIKSWLVNAKGDVAARLLYDQAGGAWRLASGPAGGETIAEGREPTGQVAILGFGKTPGEILIRAGAAQHDTLETLPLAGGQAAQSFDTDQAGKPLFDPETRLWIGSTGDGEHQSAQMFAPEQQARLVGGVTAFPGALTRLVSYSSGMRRMILFTMGQKDSGAYWFVDLDRSSATPIGQEYPSVTADQVGPMSWVSYQAADGLAMRGVLTLPPGRAATDLPLVVMPHGGPEDHDRPRFDYWAQAFASRGYAVFQPNFRGSDGSGNAFRDAGFGEWGRKMQTDISDGVAELARRGIVDPKRACIVGWSYGGYAALAGVTVQQGLYRCAVSVGGVADPAAFLDFQRDANGAVGAVTRFWKQYLGVEDGHEDALKAISPEDLAARADAPVLLIHGRDDTIVPYAQSEAMADALRREGKPVEVLPLPGADHWLLEEPARVAMVRASVAFVLKNDPPDGLVQSAQADTAKLH